LAMEDSPLSDPTRYRVIYQDIISLVLTSLLENQKPLIQFDLDEDGASDPEANQQFDLIIAGAFPILRGYTPWWERVQLVYSQLLLLFHNVAHGGNFIILLNTRACRWLVEVLSLLRISFRSVSTFKSRRQHQERSTSYFVCKGFNAAEELKAQYINQLSDALLRLDEVAKFCRAKPEWEEYTKYRASSWMPHSPPYPDVNSDLDCGSRMYVANLSSISDKELFDAEHRPFLNLLEKSWTLQVTGMSESIARQKY